MPSFICHRDGDAEFYVQTRCSLSAIAMLRDRLLIKRTSSSLKRHIQPRWDPRLHWQGSCSFGQRCRYLDEEDGSHFAYNRLGKRIPFHWRWRNPTDRLLHCQGSVFETRTSMVGCSVPWICKNAQDFGLPCWIQVLIHYQFVPSMYPRFKYMKSFRWLDLNFLKKYAAFKWYWDNFHDASR